MNKKISPGYLVPSAALVLKKCHVKWYSFLDKPPEPGDVVYGKVARLGQHSTLENRNGRVHVLNDGSRGVFVFGNRYAPDHYEGIVPAEPKTEVDMLARSGVVGEVKQKNSVLKDPTRIRILGYVCDDKEQVINTRNYPLIAPHKREKKPGKRSKLILVIGTSMNSGKSMTAAACCWALSTMGYEVRASKITGTASLKDILQMNDCGAKIFNDFTHFGYPSTYKLPPEELVRIFNDTDLRYANNARNYWVVELADGILQRETAILLASDEVRSRIHRLLFCAGDALGCVGGLEILKERFQLAPDAVSGVLSSSPLALQELADCRGDIPVFNSLERNLNQLSEILI